MSTCLRLKVWWKEEQMNWNVIHNLSYWTSNEPRITTDFLKIQLSPKFIDNQRIAATDICILVSIFVHICINSFRRCYTWFGAHPNYIQVVKHLINIKKKKDKKNIAQIETNIKDRQTARLLARSQFASGRSCDRPTRSRLSVVFLGPRANAELVPKFHVALHASIQLSQNKINIKNFTLMYPSWCRIEIR
jgi:hypothetical protein